MSASYIVDEFDNHYKDTLNDEDESQVTVTVIESGNLQVQRHRSSSSISDKSESSPNLLLNEELLKKPDSIEIIAISPSSKYSSEAESVNEQPMGGINENQINEMSKIDPAKDTRRSFESSTSEDESEKSNDKSENQNMSGSNDDLNNEDNNNDGSKSPRGLDVSQTTSSDGSVDDLIIECKVDYYLKDSDDSSSLSDSSDSEVSEAKQKELANEKEVAVVPSGRNLVATSNTNDSVFMTSQADEDSLQVIIRINIFFLFRDFIKLKLSMFVKVEDKLNTEFDPQIKKKTYI